LSAALFKRVCILSVDTVQVQSLRMSFNIVKSTGRHPNTSQISVWNLAKDSRAAMALKGAKVILEAGYEGQSMQVFNGDARTIDHHLEGPDWVTKIQCGDGEKAYQLARVSKSFKGGTSVGQVLRHFIDALGINPGNSLKEIAGIKEQFVHGYTAHGQAATEMDRLLKSYGYEWSIQDGRLQVIPKGKTTADSVVSLSPDTGLVGSPELGNKDKQKKHAVLKAKALLQPSLSPGRRFELQSREHHGLFRVEQVTHKGDTHGGEWYSEIEAVPAP
jgi:hypothetical protein